MTDTEQRPRWEAGNYLAGLKGVTIPNTAPSFNGDPRKGRHWSSDNAIDANDEGIKSIFDSLKSMPTLKDVPVDVPEPLPAEQQKPAAQDPQPFVAQNPTVQQSTVQQSSKPAEIQQTEAYDFPTTPKRETVNQEQLRFHEQDTELTPVVEMHGPVQQIDSDPPSFIPGSTPFQKTSADVTQTAVQQPVPTIVNHVLPMDDKLAHTEPQPNYDQNPFADFVIPDTNDSDEDAIPEQRKIKARQVEETLRAEHPDADDEFVSAVRQLVELNASDLHLVVNDPLMLRVDGKLRPAKGLSVWTKDHTYEAVKVMTNELELERFKDDLELDISFAIGDLLRFRVNVYRDRMGVCAALRTIPTEIKTAKELGLDPRIAELALLPRGLVLVCGPTGSGKSTTLAAIVDKANAKRADHIVTIEDPIEFVHQHKRCVMSQREVGTDTKSFAEALKRALREDPDIIEVGELRDLETISTALTAVETGHLVFATLHTQDAGSTVDRLIDVYPENQQQQIRVQVASTLRAVIVQTLIPRANGHGRAPATEVMINNPAVAALIRSGKAHQIRTVLQAGEKEGMHTLDQDLARLANKGIITFEDALVKVQVREEFEKLCGARSSF